MPPIPKSKQTTLELYVLAAQANEMKNNNPKKVLFVDVRTRAEVAFIGMPSNADANIPYMIVGDWDEWDEEKHTFKLFPNSNFLTYFNDYILEHGFNKSSTIILMCHSGNRSAGAVNLLAQVGYTKVYSVIDGFDGWTQEEVSNDTAKGWKRSGLPWTKKLDEEKMYMEF